MDMIEVKCKNCGAPIDDGNIELRLSMARCSHCNSVFSLSDYPGSKENSGAAREQLQIPMPEKMKISNEKGKLVISYKWFKYIFIFMAFFCLVWNGFMIMWHTISISSGVWYMSLFGILHTAVGIGLTYYTIAGFFNTTTITAGMGSLEIHHHPLPWKGNRTIKTTSIKQLYSREKISRGKDGPGYSYELYAVETVTNKRIKLLGGFQEAEQVLYLEQEIERYLGIKDTPVQGEITR